MRHGKPHTTTLFPSVICLKPALVWCTSSSYCPATSLLYESTCYILNTFSYYFLLCKLIIPFCALHCRILKAWDKKLQNLFPMSISLIKEILNQPCIVSTIIHHRWHLQTKHASIATVVVNLQKEKHELNVDESRTKYIIAEKSDVI